jgi:hypothetical protein
LDELFVKSDTVPEFVNHSFAFPGDIEGCHLAFGSMPGGHEISQTISALSMCDFLPAVAISSSILLAALVS